MRRQTIAGINLPPHMCMSFMMSLLAGTLLAVQ
jgi:hypothetical protein